MIGHTGGEGGYGNESFSEGGGVGRIALLSVRAACELIDDLSLFVFLWDVILVEAFGRLWDNFYAFGRAL